jgi:hypothetical protein
MVFLTYVYVRYKNCMNYTAPNKANLDIFLLMAPRRCFKFRDAVDNYHCTGAFMTAYLLSAVESSSITMADVGPSHSGHVSLLLR